MSHICSWKHASGTFNTNIYILITHAMMNCWYSTHEVLHNPFESFLVMLSFATCLLSCLDWLYVNSYVSSLISLLAWLLSSRLTNSFKVLSQDDSFSLSSTSLSLCQSSWITITINPLDHPESIQLLHLSPCGKTGPTLPHRVARSKLMVRWHQGLGLLCIQYESGI